MPKQSEIDRMLVLFYRSSNSQDWVNFTRPYGWLDALPMTGLDELSSLLDRMKEDVAAEAARRQKAGQTTYPLGEYVGEKAVN